MFRLRKPLWLTNSPISGISKRCRGAVSSKALPRISQHFPLNTCIAILFNSRTMTSLPIKSHPLDPHPLTDLASLLATNLKPHFRDVSASVVRCPDLRQPPFHLAASGLCGNEKIADIGGPPYLHPFPNFTKKYEFLDLPKLLEMSPGKGFMLGAGAGPFHVVGRNSELMPNLSYEGDEVRLSSLSQSFIFSLSKTRVLRSSSPEIPLESKNHSLSNELYCTGILV